MSKKRIVIVWVTVLLVASFLVLAKHNMNRIETSNLVKELQYRQKEAYNQWMYLSEKGDKIHKETSKEVEAYNENPTEASLSRISTLKNQAIDTFHIEIGLLMDYIEYLENKLSKLTKDKFKPLKRSAEKR